MTQALGIELFYPSVHTVLDFFGLAVYIVGVIAMAAGVTWLVVRISPTRDPEADEDDLAQDTLERRVLEVVRLGDRAVGDLPADHVDARGK